MNLELFDKVKQAITEHPRQVDMYVYYDDICGTAACIAGWALIAAGENPKAIPYENIPFRAMSLLDMEDMALFFTWRWPDGLRNKLNNAWKPEEYAAVCCKAIDDYTANKRGFKRQIGGGRTI